MTERARNPAEHLSGAAAPLSGAAERRSGAAERRSRRYASKTLDERREERRARLLAAGLDLFAANGFAGTTIEALCAAAGVSTRNFYEEFGSREALVVALHDDVNA